MARPLFLVALGVSSDLLPSSDSDFDFSDAEFANSTFCASFFGESAFSLSDCCTNFRYLDLLAKYERVKYRHTLRALRDSFCSFSS